MTLKQSLENLREILEAGNPDYLDEYDSLEDAVKADGSSEALEAYEICYQYPEFRLARKAAQRAHNWSEVVKQAKAQREAERKLAARGGFVL